jgi:hypothetical protein
LRKRVFVLNKNCSGLKRRGGARQKRNIDD